MVASAAMKIAVGRVLLFALAWIPLRVQGGLAAVVAGLVRATGWRKLEVIDGNLRLAFPDLDDDRRRRLARDNVRAMVSTAMECGPLWHRSPRWIDRALADVSGIHHLQAAWERGQGVLLLGGHLGNWELSILYGSLTRQIDFLYKPPRSRRVDELLTRYRSRFGATMVPTAGPAMRQVLRRLRQGGIVGLLFDQLPRGGDHVAAPFFGHPVATMTLPHRLARATGCAVLMGHCLRRRDGPGWQVRFDPVPGADDPDPVRAAAAMNATLERVVRAAPEQYLWHYRRFDEVRSADRPGAATARPASSSGA